MGPPVTLRTFRFGGDQYKKSGVPELVTARSTCWRLVLGGEREERPTEV